jgi:cytochrome c peroxidase
MHNLEAERFYKQTLAGGMMMAHDGPIKTFRLRGIKDSPPYLHDGRCLTLQDTVEYFNLIQQFRLAPQEKKDLVALLEQDVDERRRPPEIGRSNTRPAAARQRGGPSAVNSSPRLS